MNFQITRCVLIGLFFTIGFKPGQMAISADEPSKLTVASYNAENMFDVFDDPYTRDEQSAVKPRAQIEQIARAVRALNAHVVAFAEIETEGILRAMVHEMLTESGYKDIAVMPTNSDRGIHLGIISKLPIVSLTSHRFARLTLEGEPRSWRFARDLLQVRLRVTPTRTADLFIAHFKSKHDSPEDPESRKWRLAEATMVRQIIDRHLQAHPDAWILLVGDLNDTLDSLTMRTLLSSDSDGRWSLADAHSEVPPEERITYLRAPYRSTIDYILTSPAMASRLEPGSAQILSDRSMLGGSDHAPIVASFDLFE